jgi:site-specific recombinase XerD
MTDTDRVLKDFERALKIAGIKVWSQYVTSVREFLDYIAERGIAYTAVNEGVCADYKAHLLSGDTELSRFTINNKLNRLRKFYKYLYRKRRVCANPFAGEHAIRVGRTLPKNILAVEELGKLLDSFALVTRNDIMMKAIVELLYGSALRISEAIDLTLSDIDFEAGVLHITDYKNGGARMKRPATEVSLRFLKRYMREARGNILTHAEMKAGRLFPKKRYTSMRCMINHKLKRECLRIGLATITTHSFRHSAATHLLRAGAGIREVQEMLGHDKISSTEAYTRIVKEDLKNVIEKCHPREAHVSAESSEKGKDENDEGNKIQEVANHSR